MFAALHFRNFRFWFIGQLASLVGTWMQATAQAYLVFELTHSPIFLGYVGFAAGAPSLLTLVGGVVSDRFSKRNILILTQVTMMLLAFTLSALTFMQKIDSWHIVVLAFCLGIANAFDAPARQSIVIDLVDKKHLTNAIALNSSIFNGARAVGPAIAGITYAKFGPAWCFLINGLSFIAVIIALLLIKIPSKKKNPSEVSILDDIKEGISFAFNDRLTIFLMLIIFVTSIIGLGYVTLAPAWAVNILHGNASTVGYMQACHGLGALVGALTIASLGSFDYRGKLLMIGLFIFPCMLFLFTIARYMPFVLFILFIAGYGFMIVFNLTNAMLQSIVPDRLRGRVMSVYTLGFLGAMPIGAMTIGTLAEYTNESMALLSSAILMTFFVVWIWTKHREIYNTK
jgi:MFS family permease